MSTTEEALDAVTTSAPPPEPPEPPPLPDVLIGHRPLIRAQARRVLAARAQAPPWDDWIENLEGHLWVQIQRLSNSPPEERPTDWDDLIRNPRRFAAWCFQVMDHHFCDLIEKRQRDPLALATTGRPTHEVEQGDAFEEGIPDRSRGGSLEEWEARQDREDPFSARDLRRIGEWKPPGRLVLLCRAGLWHKVPQELWDRWVGECGLVPPFPPQSWKDCDDSERNRLLAEALGRPRNTVNKIWSRELPKLQSLDYVRGLRDEL
jgi:hypothetical protein